MIVHRIRGCTRTLGKSQHYIGLPIRDDVLIGATPEGGDARVMVSCWEPTPDELAQLNAGGKIYLTVMGTQHPPVLLSTKDPKP